MVTLKSEEHIDGLRVWDGTERSKHRKMAIALQCETAGCFEHLYEIMDETEDAISALFVGPGDLGMNMGLVGRDSYLGFMAAPELKWCLQETYQVCDHYKKVPGGFTRGGNPTTLLKAGFRFVSLSADNWDVMSAMDVYLHGQTGPAGPFQATKAGWQPGAVKALGWKSNASNTLPSWGMLASQIVPSMLGHLCSVADRATHTPTHPVPTAPSARTHTHTHCPQLPVHTPCTAHH